MPRLLANAAPTFLRFRTLWFAVQLVAVAAGLVVVARWIGGTTGAIALALSGFVLAPYGVVTTLQIGNAQLAFVALPMVAMVLFDRRRPALGGALLAYATVSKLYPALLVLYLLLRRDWRGAAWTVGLGVAIVALSLADVGWTPYVAFLDHLPRLLSGEAFPAMAVPEGMALNQSVPGLPLKLALFGLAPATLAWARVAGWIYTPLLLWATIRLARGRFASRRRADRLAHGDHARDLPQHVPAAVRRLPGAVAGRPAGGALPGPPRCARRRWPAPGRSSR